VPRDCCQYGPPLNLATPAIKVKRAKERVKRMSHSPPIRLLVADGLRASTAPVFEYKQSFRLNNQK
jgi:hypothetical protein